MKIFLQSQAAECGLACLAMIADAHGMHIGLSELRRQFPVSLNGTRLNHLAEIAQRIGMEARALRLEPESLHRMRLPCILHWDMTHFVVLRRMERNGAVIVDPASGERRVSMRELSSRFTGIALELMPTADFRRVQQAPSVSLKQLTGPVQGLWRALANVMLLSLALQVFLVIAPILIQWVVDQVLIAADKSLLTVLGVGFGLALLLQIGIGMARGLTVIHVSSQLGRQWSSNVFAHALRLPLEFFERRHLGDITSRMSSVKSIQNTLSTSFVEAIIDGLMATITLIIMLIYSWQLTLVTIGTATIYLAIRLFAFRALRDRTEHQLIAEAKQETHLLESLRGIQTIKVAGKEPIRRSVFNNLIVDTVNQDIGVERLRLTFDQASQLIFGLERIIVIVIGALLTMRNVFSVGMLVAYLAYKDQFAQRMAALIDKGIELRMLRLHGERLADIVLSEPEELDTKSSALLETRTGPVIQADNISFRYADGEPWILRHCSFEVAKGESIAIVGPSGCGKTTLMKVLLGLLKPQEGTINLAGEDIYRIGPRQARSLIGAVMQEDQLFAGTIGENISFFDQDSDDERISKAAQMAEIDAEIRAMPMGYNSLIGDMGSSLSGGQKQRVILARALYRDPEILILDEATSHLDVVRERLVNSAVKRLSITKVIVAHRPETIMSADRVLVMDAGRIDAIMSGREFAKIAGKAIVGSDGSQNEKLELES